MNALARFAIFAVALVAGSLLGGCSLPVTRAEPQLTYRLQAAPVIVPMAKVEPVAIRVLPIDTAPGLGGTAMLYSEQPNLILPYRNSHWVAPPADLVRSAVTQTLAHQPWVSVAEEEAGLIPANWLLHCDLTRLENDVSGPQGIVRLDMTCQLMQTDPRHLVEHWHVSEEQPLAQNNAAEYAQTAQSLLNEALARIVTELAQACENPSN